MKKTITLITLLLVTSLGLSALDYGAKGASSRTDYTLEDMLLYALQDEHLALAEYEAIMEAYGAERPYLNIAEAERTHIGYVEDLYAELGWDVPDFDASAHVTVPSSLEEAASIGVQAEIDNIAMYESFLAENLPETVRDVFTDLKESSEKHLAAFERQLDKPSSRRVGSTGRNSQGRGRNALSSRG